MSMPRLRCWSSAVLPAICLAAALIAPGCRGSQSPPGRGAPRTYGADYVAALDAANRFCGAWRRQDLAAGKALLSLRVQRTFPDARIKDAIVGAANPRHAAFEIAEGQSAGPATYAFRLRLFLRFTGQAEDRIEAPLEQIVVRQDESGKWLVDGFPLLQ